MHVLIGCRCRSRNRNDVRKVGKILESSFPTILLFNNYFIWIKEFFHQIHSNRISVSGKLGLDLVWDLLADSTYNANRMLQPLRAEFTSSPGLSCGLR